MSKIIVIDPGHGGRDPGAASPVLREKDLVLNISRGVKEGLLPYDCQVQLTREDDSYVDLAARADYANRVSADFFLSVHVNAGGGTGFESFIYINPSALEQRYQEVVHSSVTAYLDGFGRVDRGRKQANFAVLRLTTMPAILLENLFVDNESDATLLADQSFLEGLSGSIVKGIVTALEIPLKAKPWDPSWEIAQLKAGGLITTLRQPETNVLWGQLATVLNRLRNVPPASKGDWDPEGEINLLISDQILNTPRKPQKKVIWGEFATVFNRLRKRPVPATTWDPAAEIQALIDDKLVISPRDPSTNLKWGEFATVVNRFRGIRGG